MIIRVEVTADRRFGTNSYLVEDETTHDAAIIDSNLEPDLMIELGGRRAARVRAILLTHTDLDHIGGLHELIAAFGPVPVAVHEAERHVVAEGKPLRRELGPTRSDAFGMGTPVDGVVDLTDGQAFHAGSLVFEVLHTPGHSPGGVTLKIDGFLFTGDALFLGSIGRSDFANSDGQALVDGVRTRLLTQPDESIVYSGHGPATTIGRERKTNPFLQ